MKIICSIIRAYSISDDNKLFDQTACVIKYGTDEILHVWNESAIETACGGSKCFSILTAIRSSLATILRLAQFGSSLADTNAQIETDAETLLKKTH